MTLPGIATSHANRSDAVEMMMHKSAEETKKLEQRKYVLLKFLSIEPDTMGGLKFLIGGDSNLTERALHSLVKEGKVTYRRGGMYFPKKAVSL